MSAQDVATLEENPEWRLLLTAYHARQLASADGWVDRIMDLPELPEDQLSRIHGRLIALGLMEFELGGRGDGMRYKLSPDGLRSLRPSSEIVESESDEAEEEEEAASADERDAEPNRAAA